MIYIQPPPSATFFFVLYLCSLASCMCSTSTVTCTFTPSLSFTSSQCSVLYHTIILTLRIMSFSLTDFLYVSNLYHYSALHLYQSLYTLICDQPLAFSFIFSLPLMSFLPLADRPDLCVQPHRGDGMPHLAGRLRSCWVVTLGSWHPPARSCQVRSAWLYCVGRSLWLTFKLVFCFCYFFIFHLCFYCCLYYYYYCLLLRKAIKVLVGVLSVCLFVKYLK